MLQLLRCNDVGLGKGFYVATEFDQGEEILCRDREFDVVKELLEIVSRQSISYIAIDSSRT